MLYKITLAFIKGMRVRWQDIARELGLSESTIQRIDMAHQGKTEFCCKQMIEECLTGNEKKMTLHSLSEALKKLRIEGLIDNFYKFCGKH